MKGGERKGEERGRGEREEGGREMRDPTNLRNWLVCA
jgi:hypothetical protein